MGEVDAPLSGGGDDAGQRITLLANGCGVRLDGGDCSARGKPRSGFAVSPRRARPTRMQEPEFGLSGDDVVGEVLDEAQRPQQQR